MNILWLVSFFLSSCTFAVTINHAQGANDSLAEDQRASAQVSPTITVPL